MLIRSSIGILLVALVITDLAHGATTSFCGELFQTTNEPALPFEITMSNGSDHDFRAIIRIANQHRDELGQVLKHNLKIGVQENSLLVARDPTGQIIGFILWHTRLDGWSTIYDLAVDRAFGRLGLGRALMRHVPQPRQLKTTASNGHARNFYLNLGFSESGRSFSRNGRELIKYRDTNH